MYDETDPVPPSRPIIAGNIGINRCLSEIVSLIIEPVTLNMGGCAIESTSDMLGKITELNKSGVIEMLHNNEPELEEVFESRNKEEDNVKVLATASELLKLSIMNRLEKLRTASEENSYVPDMRRRLIGVGLIDRLEGGDVPITLLKQLIKKQMVEHAPPVHEKGFVIIGSNVEQLFPSLKPLKAARLARLAILESKFEFDDIKYALGLRYLYICGGKEVLDRAGLIKFCPKWLV